MERRDPNVGDFSLLHQDEYTVAELARLVDRDHHLIERAVFNGQLKATIVDHHIVSIKREDAIAWLSDNG
jgi:hypothetical protein